MQVKYPTVIKQRRLNGKLYVLEVIRDLDEAIDILCDSMSESEKLDPFAEELCPYFGILWPAAEALAQFLSEQADMLRDKRVLELGCGLGFPSLVASHLGAKVLATDYHPQVAEYFLGNCRHSSVECDYLRLNWREHSQDIGKFDVVMGSDVLYESKHPEEVVKGITRFLAPTGKIILADPGRAYLQNFVTTLKAAGFNEEMHSLAVEDKEIFVFVFQ